MQKCKDLYPNQKILSFSVFPCPKVSDVVVEPYNTTLTVHRLQEYCDGIFVISNEKLYDIASRKLYDITSRKYQQNQPKYDDLNFICNQMINDVTSIFRYDDSYGFNVDIFLKEMVKYPNLKYFCSSRVPFCDDEKLNVDDTFLLTTKLFERERSFVSYNRSDDPYTNISTLIIYRGFNEINDKEIANKIQNGENRWKFKDDIISTVIKNVHSLNVSQSVGMIANSSQIRNELSLFSRRYAKMYRRKAFLHWYKGEGMDEDEFQNADQTVRDLISQYVDIDHEHEQ